ncbi:MULTISPECIES: hypothetical protein [unclassified Pseudoalteromonas]|uniref:hypothetical protein n=1 Tax=unclassified Pseudoalteromonas TaxID=194690 RepID=UPI001B3A2145|nr:MULTISPECIES: hypothetical protein [unclassified Pseudoalteromonas]MBQ4847991.1 hypothetical protein [Pseudoalteromonas sp. MMG005]MBQ4852877.1 hypothetical protein [Pseudoalteromonas sp. MMG012]
MKISINKKQLKQLTPTNTLSEAATLYVAGAGPKTARACNSRGCNDTVHCTGQEVCWDHTTPERGCR